MAKMKLGTKTRRTIARTTGIPTTRSGRSRKVSRATGGCLTLILMAFFFALLLLCVVPALSEEAVPENPWAYLECAGYSVRHSELKPPLNDGIDQCALFESNTGDTINISLNNVMFHISDAANTADDVLRTRALFLSIVAFGNWDTSWYIPVGHDESTAAICYKDLRWSADQEYDDFDQYLHALVDILRSAPVQLADDAEALREEQYQGAMDRLKKALGWNATATNSSSPALDYAESQGYTVNNDGDELLGNCLLAEDVGHDYMISFEENGHRYTIIGDCVVPSERWKARDTFLGLLDLATFSRATFFPSGSSTTIEYSPDASTASTGSACYTDLDRYKAVLAEYYDVNP